ncbi:MAG TPA: tetratricopeptide repeat protein, partial [Pyrinomonadaceae bacterium]
MSKWNRIGAAALAAALVLSPFASPARAAAVAPAAQQEDAPSQAEQETFNRGRALFARGQYEQAAGIFRDFLKVNPNSFIADLMLLWMGRSYIELGRFDEAAQVVQRLREIKDTPFTDIFETELQTARTEAAARPPAGPAPRPTATPATAVARATPTPARARPTPRPTPV